MALINFSLFETTVDSNQLASDEAVWSDSDCFPLWLILFVLMLYIQSCRDDFLSSWVEPGPEVIKLFSCSTQLSTNFILLINVKMPTIVGILTFISMINTTSVRLTAIKNSLFVAILVFMSSWKFMLIWVQHGKSFITSGPVLSSG